MIAHGAGLVQGPPPSAGSVRRPSHRADAARRPQRSAGCDRTIAIHPGHEQLVAPYFFEHAGSRSGSSRLEPAQAGDQDSADDPGSQADEEAGAGGQLKPRCRDDPKDQNDDGDDAVGRPNRLGPVPEEPTGDQALLQTYWAND